MKNLPLLYWMEDIDPALIERSDKYRGKRRNPYLRIAPVAAAVLVVLTVMLSAFAAWRVDSYLQNAYADSYDGTVLHALDIVLTQDDNAVSALISEQNKHDLHSLFNALRGVEEQEKETEQKPESHGSEGLEYRSRGDGTCSLIGFGSCRDAHVVIPQYAPNGELVVDIAEGAFENNVTMTRITMSDSVQTIRDSAFSGCSRLEEINLPESLVSIGKEAFRSCWRLSKLHIPGSVAYVGDTFIGMCIMLETLTVDPENPVYRTEGNCLIDVASNRLLAGCAGSVIPEGVTEIAPKAFYCMSGLRSVVIPEGVTSIGYQAFLGCTMLREVTFPSTLVTIEKQAFSECSALRSVVRPEGLLSLESYAFSKCSNLTSVALPSSLLSIEDGAFMECTALTEIDIPFGIAEIGNETFYGCTKLARVGIPDSVQSIKSYAFYQCEGLAELDLPPQLQSIGKSAFFLCSSLTSVTLPEGLTELGSFAFSSSHAIREVSIPSTLSKIPDNAFSCCSALESVVISEGVVSIGAEAFESCYTMKAIHIPSTVIEIEERAFLTCNELSALTVSEQNPRYKSEGNCLVDTVTGTVLFGNSYSEIPSGVRVIGAYALSDCDLRRITLPDGVEIIEQYAFYSSWGTVSVVIPASVTLIADSAFASCFYISNVYYAGTEEQWEQITIEANNEELLDSILHFEYVPDT